MVSSVRKSAAGVLCNVWVLLFWDRIDGQKIAIAMGAFDGSTGISLAHHIFVADKGDYYEIMDGVPQNQQ